MEQTWGSALSQAAESLDQVRRDLGHFDAHALRLVGAERQALLRSRATTYVWLSAIMERFVKEWMKAICHDFSSLGVPWKDVRPSIFSVACGSELQAISDGVKKELWAKRIAIFNRTLGNEPVRLNHAFVPLDGKTIRPRHMEDIWSVFGLPMPIFPSPVHSAVLTTVADYRNDLAHGDESPSTIGAKLTYADVLRYVQRFEDMIEHCCLSTEKYFRQGMYLRS